MWAYTGHSLGWWAAAGEQWNAGRTCSDTSIKTQRGFLVLRFLVCFFFRRLLSALRLGITMKKIIRRILKYHGNTCILEIQPAAPLCVIVPKHVAVSLGQTLEKKPSICLWARQPCVYLFCYTLVMYGWNLGLSYTSCNNRIIPILGKMKRNK